MVAATTKSSQTLPKAKTPPRNEAGLNQVCQTTDMPPCNKDGLKLLREQKNRYTLIFLLCSISALGFSLAGYLLGLLAMGGSYSAADNTAKYARLEKVLTLLLDKFEKSHIQAFPVLTMQEQGEYEYIDLYVRFPKGQVFIETRSLGNGAVVYNEAKETLYLKRGKKGLSKVLPCPLSGLNESKKWLSKNRQKFGLSSRQATKDPTVKVLVMWGETQISNHRDYLYTQVGERKYLMLSKRGSTTFVVQQEELAMFISDWLSQCRN
ncbi:MAG: hypothetical protein AAGE59_19795 [Cyanobacteria bacterium P01_F01_bin.86]